MSVKKYTVDGDNVTGDHTLYSGDSVEIDGQTTCTLHVMDGGADVTEKLFGVRALPLGKAMSLADPSATGKYQVVAQEGGRCTGTNGQLNVGSR